ncbi:MAG: GNAT family N-acetyltransferase [Thermodesulfobacteriota bacterium]
MPTIHKVHTNQEIDRVAALAREIWYEHYTPIIGQAQVDYMVPKFQSPEAIAAQIHGGARYDLILEHHEAIGYIGVVPDPEAGELFLSKIYVRRERRGQGLGRLALEHVESVARDLKTLYIWLTVNKNNTASIRAYEHMGFIQRRAICQDIGQGFVMDDYLMDKTLSYPP